MRGSHGDEDVAVGLPVCNSRWAVTTVSEESPDSVFGAETSVFAHESARRYIPEVNIGMQAVTCELKTVFMTRCTYTADKSSCTCQQNWLYSSRRTPQGNIQYWKTISCQKLLVRAVRISVLSRNKTTRQPLF
jgi:hypothetical protein